MLILQEQMLNFLIIKILISQMLKDFLNLFKSSKKLQLLSSEFSDTEKIARSVFSPVNVNKSDELRTNVYKSPAEMDEVSVNRLDYTNADNLKNLSKKNRESIE